ncbi:aminoacyl tRNA synthase complex-interacting multifunctional protein 1 [Diorhabda carinulata]|uniref:aminoacyl tRNA synthase complex-interacting multifunctional protein 1 n=1 Tax=Diorhabda carinulata TaxID=1163345 RepID=UPI0025A1E43B|nr:aminoacyl tRNA synthase complex-interacting multifunctional protein 1 [Diorhabda carinulata]
MYLRLGHIFFVTKINFRMSGKEAIQRIKQNAQVAKQTIDELKNELNILNNEYNAILTRQLQEENSKLVAAVEDAKNKLIQLEIRNGIKQIPIPNQPLSTFTPEIPDAKPVLKENVQAPTKPKKEKKDTPVNQQKPSNDLPIDVGRLDLRIGKIEDIKRHPDADSLYVLQIDVGEKKPRTVCSGLVKYVPMEDLQNKMVVVLCNLKPVKMRGITSEAMVMCAVQTEEGGSIIETIIPPENSNPGDLVHCEGYTRQPDSIMNPKKKIFETVAPDLHTNDTLQVCYKNVPFQVTGKGICHSKTLKNVVVR